jgi:hypothetical protein
MEYSIKEMNTQNPWDFVRNSCGIVDPDES